MGEKFKFFICTAGWLGLSPYFPGSCGALLGVGFHLSVAYFTPHHYHKWFLIAGCLSVSIALFSLNSWAESYWGEEDSKHFVLDEVAGYLVVPIFFDKGEPWQIALFGYLLFRIFDIIKIPPAKQIDQKMKNAAGVLLDDIVSALYAVAVMYIGSVVI